jgi:hypothetical protein
VAERTVSLVGSLCTRCRCGSLNRGLGVVSIETLFETISRELASTTPPAAGGASE